MLGESIRYILLADSTVSGLVGARIYPLDLPLKTTFPALTYAIISDPFKIAVRSARFQINCFADGYLEREELKQAVEDALKFYYGLSQGIEFEMIFPLGPYNHIKDSTTGFYYLPYDFKVNYYTN
jgi:hypothetical protein